MTQKKEGLREFQKKVRQLVTDGENVIIHVPTGAGKTRAALTPFMDNLQVEGDKLPLHCLYATPMRVLSNQFHHLYKGILTHMDKVKGTDFFRQYGYELLGDAMVSLQTGEQPDDPQFEALLTFCTIDQLLASFLGVPYSVGRRLANINVGAVLSSYLVLDEFHLYPLLNDGESSFGARTTTLAMLSLLSGITRFVLMTATLSTELLQQMAQLLNAKVVTMDASELEEISDGRQRWFEVAEGSMTAEQILSRHYSCSLVVCNTVSSAQATYWALREEARAQGIQLELLHSRLTDTDRAARSQRIIEALGPANWQQGVYQRGQGIIVVATQVVEVGLDISVETLYTEIAPANSLIQRAGRCARYAQQKGHVIVYELPEKNGKPASWLPYDKARCMATMNELKERDTQQPMDFFAEQALIDAVHTQEDRELLQRFRKQRGEIEKRIFVALKEGNTSVLSTLIRNVMQVQMIIHDHPQRDIKSEPWRYQSFSIHPESLAKYLTMVEPKKDIDGLEWACKEAVAQSQGQTDEEDTRVATIYDWPSVGFIANQHAMATYLRGTLMLALPNQLATYHDELGFVLRDETLNISWPTYESPLLDKRGQRYQRKPIRRQSYQEHISGLVQAYNSGIAQSLAYAIHQLETKMGLLQGQIDHAIRLAIACHDVGKLGEQWQHWAYEWQVLLYAQMGWQPFSSDPIFFFAKTDYDSHNHKQRQWQSDMKIPRPPHACESVGLSHSLIAESLGITSGDDPLLRAVCGAIARHHSALAAEYAPIRLKDGALVAVQEALEIARQTHSWGFELPRLRTKLERSNSLAPSDAPLITIPEQGKRSQLETWLYYVIARALRLADQRADDFNGR